VIVMKKGLSIILAIMVCFTFVASALAEDAVEDNVSASISSEPVAASMKESAEGMNKSSGANPSTADLIRFVPTTIDVSSNKVVVGGYFINMSSTTVANFRDYYMDVYTNGNLLVSGEFGTINQFSVYPGSTKYQTFTFTGSHNLNAGSYVCDDTCYAVIACRFSAA